MWAYGYSYDALFHDSANAPFAALGVGDRLYVTPDDLLDLLPSTLVTGFNTSSIVTAVYSPAHVELTDPLGRRLVIGPDGVRRDEIPARDGSTSGPMRECRQLGPALVGRSP